MTLREKAWLVERFAAALRECGAFVRFLTPSSVHPAEMEIVGGRQHRRLLLYIWNITHGGMTRAEDEYRIQITGVETIAPRKGASLIVLGWWDEGAVFAGWDPQRHSGPVSHSPSMQVKRQSLHEAYKRGLSLCYRGQGEITVAFRPDNAMLYVENLAELHGPSHTQEDVDEIEESVRKADEDDKPLPEPPATPTPRERIESVLTRAIRDGSFRRRVLVPCQSTNDG